MESLPPFGQPAAWDAPAGIPIWGARWIYPDDQVHNRQGFNDVEAGRDRLQTWLNHDDTDVPDRSRISHAMERAVELDREIKIRQSTKEVVTLYEDDRGVIKGNPNGSFGYLYVAAWLKPDPVGGNA